MALTELLARDEIQSENLFTLDENFLCFRFEKGGIL